jgi:hypothetical protein
MGCMARRRKVAEQKRVKDAKVATEKKKAVAKESAPQPAKRKES